LQWAPGLDIDHRIITYWVTNRGQDANPVR
jgi:hypothetical protein